MTDPGQVILSQLATYGRVRFLVTKKGFTPMTQCEQWGHEWVTLTAVAVLATGETFTAKQCEFCGQLKETM